MYLSEVICSVKKTVSKMFSDRALGGQGWRLVIINSLSEYAFIQEEEKKLSDHRDFWIGGSTDAAEGNVVSFCEYVPNSTGKRKVYDLGISLVYYDTFQASV